MKGIKREYSNARNPHQNGVVKRKNRTLIEAARTMLVDSLLPITFWAEAVNTVCYVLNRILVTKHHNKTPYELLNGRLPRLDLMRPFGYPVTILNTLDPLGKFKGKADEGFLVMYSVTSKAFREVPNQHYIVLPLWSSISSTYKSSDDKAKDDKPKDDTGSKTVVKLVNKEDQAYRDAFDRIISQEKEASNVLDSLSKEFEQGCMDQKGAAKASRTNSFNTVSNPVNAASTLGTFNTGGPSYPHPDAFIPDDTLLHVDQDDSQIPDLEDTAELRSTATHRVHLDHPKDQILEDPQSAIQTRRMAKKTFRAHAFLSYIHKQRRTNHKDYENYLFSCFLSQMEPKKVAQALYDESWVEMDVKSAFFYGTIEKEVYVSQPPGFIDPQFPNKVYKNGYRRGIIDKTLFIKTYKDDIMLVQVYVDDIIFGSTKKSLCDEFEAMMHKRFQMSSMGELTFFLRLQVKQREEGIFISQDKFQVTPKLSYIHAVKWIFRYLKGKPKLGLLYPRDFPFDLEAYLDSDYAGANLDRKSTTEEYVAAANCCKDVLWIQN
nr:putative ribonuclease H-like domain-containing protein [Tanacetum cinerariifolium]